MTNLEILKVSSSDVDQLRKLSIETFVTAFSQYNTQENMNAYLSEAFTSDQLTKEINNPYSEFHFIRSNGDLAGYTKLNIHDAQTDLKDQNSLEIERVYVVEEYQSRGLGGHLLKYAIDRAHGLQREFIWLGVWERNPRAIDFYKKHGFVEFDSHPFMLGNDRQKDLLLRLDL